VPFSLIGGEKLVDFVFDRLFGRGGVDVIAKG